MSTTIAYYFAFIALGLTGASLGPTLPGLAENTQSQLSQISILFTARALGYLIGSFFGGRVYDHYPGHPLMISGLLVMSLSMGIVPIIPLLWVLALVIFLIGIGEGGLDVGGNTLIVWIHGRKVGPFMNSLHLFFGVGALLAPVIVARMILITDDITWVYWLIAMAMIPVMIWLARLPSPKGNAAIAQTVIVNPNYRLIMLMVLIFFLYTGSEVAFGGWVFTYASTLNLASETRAAYLTSGFWSAFTIGRLLSIPIGARWRPRMILFTDLVGCLVSLTIILLLPGTGLALWIGTLGLGFFMASIFPTLLTLAESQIQISGRVTGYFFLGATGGAMVLPWLVGQFFESFGPRFLIYAIIANLTIALGVLEALFTVYKWGHVTDSV